MSHRLASRLSSQRIQWIDVAKGIAMLLVLYGHLPGSGDDPWFPGLEGSVWVVYCFHMPLFFVLSGLTLNLNKPFKQFLWQRVRRLIIPYYFFSLYALVKWLIRLASPALFTSFHGASIDGSLSELGHILLGGSNGLWFFWGLFWGEIILWAVFRLNKDFGIIIAAPVALVSWTLVEYFSPNWPFCFHTSAEAVGFVGLGMLMVRHIKSVTTRNSLYFIPISVALFTLTAWGKSHTTSWATGAVPTILAAIFGSMAVIFLARVLPSARWLTFIGRNTIVFYGLNGLSLAVAKTAFFHVVPVSFVSSNVLTQFVVGLLLVAIAVGICWIATNILNRWFWWILGIRKTTGTA